MRVLGTLSDVEFLDVLSDACGAVGAGVDDLQSILDEADRRDLNRDDWRFGSDIIQILFSSAKGVEDVSPRQAERIFATYDVINERVLERSPVGGDDVGLTDDSASSMSFS